MARSDTFYLHTVDLRRPDDELFHSFHKTSVRGQIKRAERERLSIAEGRSAELVRQFYELTVATRRRHQLPPQPIDWFTKLMDCMCEGAIIRVAYKDGRPIASLLALSFKDRAYHKYGCSDERFHSLGGMQLLLWQTILREKKRGATVLDMGRSDVRNESLATFKDHWGGARSLLMYYRYPPARDGHIVRKWSTAFARYAFARLPDSWLTAAGRVLYPHMG